MELHVLCIKMRVICWCYLEIINTERTAEGPAMQPPLSHTATFRWNHVTRNSRLHGPPRDQDVPLVHYTCSRLLVLEGG